MTESHLDQDNATVSVGSSTRKQRASSKKSLLGVIMLIVLLLVGIAAAVYLTSTKNSADTSALPVAVVHVSITAEGFVPANLQIKPNTQVVWTNKDTASHEVSLKDNNAQPLDISERLAPGESFAVILDEEKDYYVLSPTDGDKYQGAIKVNSKVNENE